MIQLNDKEKRLLKQMKTPKTANEVIDRIFDKDWSDRNFMGWKYYVHLNKLFAPLAKRGLIEQVGDKVGPTNKLEKLWMIKRQH